MNINLALRSYRTTIAVVMLSTFALLVAPATQAQAQASAQTTFASAEAASRALFGALQNHDEEAIGRILGETQSKQEKRDEERLEREQFAKKYEEMHRLGRARNGRMVLYVGAENWPFPFPLISQNNTWRFDAIAGEKEILFRRIGENELTAIDICRALAKAAPHPQAHQDDDLLGTLLVDAERGGTPSLYRGYRFRVLNRGRKDFVVVAYPEAYRSSGVMTFIVGQHAVVYAKDLGTNTTELANAMTGYRSDRSWKEEPAASSP
jgi:hypothetical protein